MSQETQPQPPGREHEWTAPGWALLVINSANLAWAVTFIANALAESSTSHHRPEMIALLAVAAFGVMTAILSLIWTKHKRPYAICSGVALLAYLSGWLWFFGAHSF